MADNKKEEILRSSQNDNDKMNKIISLCKRRGFIYPASEIYGGFANAFDFGPLGSQLKKNFKDAWWQKFVTEREDMVGLDSAIIQNPKVWEASGHLKSFSDPLVECKKCHQRFREDHVKEANEIAKENITSEQKEMIECKKGGTHEFTEAKNFNLMFKTFIGVSDDSASVAYLRPETAQGIFTNFQNVIQSTRVKLPFGIAQIGKAFRNEITPGNFIFRTREFEQLEIEYFVLPDKEESNKWYEYWINESKSFYSNLGIKEANLSVREHAPEELSHYSIGTSDIEYKFPFGVSELSGIAQRADYDLKAHKLDYFEDSDPSTGSGQGGKRLIPYVVEPSMGVDRALLAFLIDAYDESDGSDGRAEGEVTLRLSQKLAPFKVAVFPLMKKEGMPDVAHKIAAEIKSNGISTYYDESGSVGKRYRRQDEIGTPWCITVDFDSLTDKSVTVRDRDTMKQERVAINEVTNFVYNKLRA